MLLERFRGHTQTLRFDPPEAFLPLRYQLCPVPPSIALLWPLRSDGQVQGSTLLHMHFLPPKPLSFWIPCAKLCLCLTRHRRIRSRVFQIFGRRALRILCLPQLLFPSPLLQKPFHRRKVTLCAHINFTSLHLGLPAAHRIRTATTLVGPLHKFAREHTLGLLRLTSREMCLPSRLAVLVKLRTLLALCPRQRGHIELLLHRKRASLTLVCLTLFKNRLYHR
jgi:hypothetical protein